MILIGLTPFMDVSCGVYGLVLCWDWAVLEKESFEPNHNGQIVSTPITN
jgi:hypothetical protein